MNDNWGLTERGFLRPSYADLLDAFEVKAKELFGSTVNLSVRSPLGIFLRIFAWFAGLTWQLAEDVYNSGRQPGPSGRVYRHPRAGGAESDRQHHDHRRRRCDDLRRLHRAGAQQSTLRNSGGRDHRQQRHGHCADPGV